MPDFTPQERERIQKWTDALRSDQFTKTVGDLRIQSGDGGFCFCALGVACQLYHDEHPRTSRWNSSEFFVEDADVVYSEDYQLPWPVQKWLGGIGKNPELDAFSGDCLEWRDIIYLNDKKRMSFAKIADLIEQTFLANSALEVASTDA
ncbi:MAG: hypothetical protein AAGF99_00280 [Bacteroidota bacterium]